ncbi:MAG: hypothetical protein K2Q12_04655, partial [Rickettsiales bacterium]|nr:hypothetical protein [Rickettsiales bacterium]
ALGVEDAYIKEVLQLVKQLPDRKFSANAIENWKFGRLQPGMQNAGVHEKIEAGLMPRIHAKINGLIGFFKNQSIDLPAIGELEKEIAGRLQLLPPNVLEAYFRRGGMVIYNPASSLNGRGLLGLNQHTKAHPDDVLGMDLVFVSGGTGADKSQGTLVHEITHTLYPNYLTETDIARTDALALSDKQRLEKLHTLLGQWIKSDKPEEKAALEAQVETGFAVAGVPWSKIRGNADMHSLYTLVNEAWANLTAESPKLILSGYSEPEKRMAEVNSRYADLRFVRYREQPDLLHFVVPGLTESYEQIYLPHIERALSDLRVRQTPKTPLEAAKTSSIVVPNAQATRTLEVGETQSPSMTIDTQGVAHAGMAAAATQNVEASRALH